MIKGLNKIEEGIKTVIKETAWAITWNTLDAIKAYRGGAVGEDNDYQFSWDLLDEISEEEAKKYCSLPRLAGLHGRCGYGSSMIVADNYCRMSTCGGHGVDITVTESGEIEFTPDAEFSYQSWGDAAEEEESDFLIDDETRRFRRVQRLKAALREVEK